MLTTSKPGFPTGHNVHVDTRALLDLGASWQRLQVLAQADLTSARAISGQLARAISGQMPRLSKHTIMHPSNTSYQGHWRPTIAANAPAGRNAQTRRVLYDAQWAHLWYTKWKGASLCFPQSLHITAYMCTKHKAEIAASL